MALADTDRELLRQAIDWIAGGERVALVTVGKTWGSSPRPVGSLMLLRGDGVHAGSVSGGCVEEDLVRRYCNHELTALPTRIDYGVDRQRALRFGLPCGGRLELVVEQLDNTSSLQTLLDRIESGELVKRRLCLRTGEVSLHRAEESEEFVYQDDSVNKVFGPNWHILIIGAGHLSRYVAEMAQMLNYHITVCDPRDEYEMDWATTGVSFTRSMPDDAVQQVARHPRGIVLTLTHDPKLDDMALMRALTLDLFYVGAIGSTRNNQMRRERLLKLGVTPSQLKGLHAPVGLPIGSRTPPEIAISILAEITAERHHAAHSSRLRS